MLRMSSSGGIPDERRREEGARGHADVHVELVHLPTFEVGVQRDETAELEGAATDGTTCEH
jgi:hypothetical protein